MDAASLRSLQIADYQRAPFIEKLASLVDNPDHDHLIRWSDDGTSFIVADRKMFSEILLPEMFKHQNFPSFVRQLNTYGFQKVTPMSQVVVRDESKPVDATEYRHPFFMQGHPGLLCRIKRNQGRRELLPALGIYGFPGGTQLLDIGQSSQQQHITQGSNFPARDVNLLRHSLQEAREQQNLITRAINGLQNVNKDLSDQNYVFQQLHDQHENSINAILNSFSVLFPQSINDFIHGRDGSIKFSDQVATAPQQQLDSQEIVQRDFDRQHDYARLHSDPFSSSTNASSSRALTDMTVLEPTQAPLGGAMNPSSAEPDLMSAIANAPLSTTTMEAPLHGGASDVSHSHLNVLDGPSYDDMQTVFFDGPGILPTSAQETTPREQQPLDADLGPEQLECMQRDQNLRISNIMAIVDRLSPRPRGEDESYGLDLADDVGGYFTGHHHPPAHPDKEA